MGYYNRFLDWFLRAGSGPEPSQPSEDVRQEARGEENEEPKDNIEINVEEVTISADTGKGQTDE
jgi:hypothetical protein